MDSVVAIRRFAGFGARSPSGYRSAPIGARKRDVLPHLRAVVGFEDRRR